MGGPFGLGATVRSCTRMLGVVSLLAAVTAGLALLTPALPSSEAAGLLPVANAICVVCAVIIGCLLYERARAEREPRLAWLATGFAASALTMLAMLIGIPSYDAAGGPLGTTSDGLLGLYLLFHVLLASSALLALSGAASGRRARAAFLAGGAAATGYFALGGLPLPDLVGPQANYTALTIVGQCCLTALTALVTYRLWRARVRAPLWAQPLITAAFGCATWELIFHTLSRSRYSSLWWASLGMRLSAFILLALGLLVGVLALARTLERFTDDLLHRLAAGEAEGATPPVPAVSGARPATLSLASVVDLREVEPVFQPVVDLRTGRTVGVEALARFPSRPGISPAVVFAQAAQEGLSRSLELTVVDAVLARMPDLAPDTWVAINVSPATLSAPQLGDRLDAVDASRVVLEITEHMPISEYDAMTAALGRLKACGARVAVDDTGAGFASFRHVVRLRPDIIKLDISLSSGIDRDPIRRALAASIITFASSVGSLVVAEGIETARERDVLAELGVPLGQGYLLGRPGQLPSPVA